MSKEKEPESSPAEDPAKPVDPSTEPVASEAEAAEVPDDAPVTDDTADEATPTDAVADDAAPEHQDDALSNEERVEGSAEPLSPDSQVPGDTDIAEPAEPEAEATEASDVTEEAETAEPVGSASEDAGDPAPAHEPHDEYPEPYTERSSFGLVAFWSLAAAVAAVLLTLWLGPKIAPHVPAWASKHLAPASDEAKQQIAALQSRVGELETAIAPFEAVTGKIAAIESTDPAAIAAAVVEMQAEIGLALEAAGSAQDTAQETQSSIADLAGEVSAGFGTADALIADTGAKIASVENSVGAQITALQQEVSALATTLAAAEARNDGSAPSPAELQAAMQALQTRVDGLASTLTVLPSLVRTEDTAGFATKADIATIQAEIAAAAAAAEEAKTIGGSALSGLESSARTAAIRSSVSVLMNRISGGLPYASALAEIEGLSGVTAPEALSSPAAEGLALHESLLSGFSDAARDAMAVSASGTADGSTSSLIAKWLESQVSVRPTSPTDGETTGAILSRIEAALEDRDLSTALAQAGTLPAAEAEAMAPWTNLLATRVGAEAALPDFIATVGGQG